jgi:hypothetical protein
MSFKDRAVRSLGSLFALMTSCAFAQEYDLSAPPAYKAAQNQLGVIRVHGSQLTVNLIHRLQVTQLAWRCLRWLPVAWQP